MRQRREIDRYLTDTDYKRGGWHGSTRESIVFQLPNEQDTRVSIRIKPSVCTINGARTKVYVAREYSLRRSTSKVASGRRENPRKRIGKEFFGRNVMISQAFRLVYATPSPAACASLRRNRCTAGLIWHHGARLACGCGCGAESMPLLCRNVAKSTRPVEVEKTTKPASTSRLPPFLCDVWMCARDASPLAGYRPPHFQCGDTGAHQPHRIYNNAATETGDRLEPVVGGSPIDSRANETPSLRL